MRERLTSYSRGRLRRKQNSFPIATVPRESLQASSRSVARRSRALGPGSESNRLERKRKLTERLQRHTHLFTMSSMLALGCCCLWGAPLVGVWTTANSGETVFARAVIRDTIPRYKTARARAFCVELVRLRSCVCLCVCVCVCVCVWGWWWGEHEEDMDKQ